MLYTSRDWPLIVEWHTLLRLFAPPRRRAAKLTSSHVSILTCEKWYWDRELTSSDWKYRKTEYRGKQFYLHWIYNKLFGTLKWHQSNRNIEPCDFEVSSFNCIHKLDYWYIFHSKKCQYRIVIAHFFAIIFKRSKALFCKHYSNIRMTHKRAALF